MLPLSMNKPDKLLKGFAFKTAKERVAKAGARSQNFGETPDELDLNEAVKRSAERELAEKLPVAVLFPPNK